MPDNRVSAGSRCLNFLEILAFHLTLPTWDCVMDLKIGILALQEEEYRWGCSLLTPILVNFCFTAYVWHSLEKTRRWTVILLLCQIWPQFRALEVMFHIVCKADQRVGYAMKEQYKREIACLEPFLEAAPQVLVKTAILAQNKEGNTSFVAKLLGEDYSVTFWLSYLVALVGTGIALVKFLKSGPCHTMRGGKGGLVPFILTFISTFGTLGVKVALLKMMASGTKGELAMLRVAVWAFCCMLPQFVIAIIALGRAFNSFSDLGILLKYPELFAAPLYIPVTFGRVRDEAGNKGKLSFSLRWTFVNMVATIAGIAALALYVELDPNVKWSPKYVATLMVVMAMAMVWMVPLMMASKYPDNILSVMYQQGVLDISEPEGQFILEWQHGEERVVRVVPLVQEEHTD